MFLEIFFLTMFVIGVLLGVEDRPQFKAVDVSPARPDDGRWL